MERRNKWKTTRSCLFKSHLHVVFVTKYRKKVLTPKMLSFIKGLFGEVCLELNAHLIEFGGEEDHVHLMISCPPNLKVSDLVGKLKGRSSFFLRKTFWNEIKKELWGRHFWSPSYCAVSCGGASLEKIRSYIEGQNTP